MNFLISHICLSLIATTLCYKASKDGKKSWANKISDSQYSLGVIFALISLAIGFGPAEINLFSLLAMKIYHIVIGASMGMVNELMTAFIFGDKVRSEESGS